MPAQKSVGCVIVFGEFPNDERVWIRAARSACCQRQETQGYVRKRWKVLERGTWSYGLARA